MDARTLQDFYFDAAYDEDGCVSGVLRLELYDWNKGGDEYVGCVDVDLAAFELDANTLVGCNGALLQPRSCE